jgi:peptide/nickel transport system ATP-binding protein
MSVRYGSGHKALTAVDEISFAVPKRGTLGVVGESGCGKTTLARAIVGLVRTTGGTITFDGQDFSRHRDRHTRAFRRRVQMVFQDPYSTLNPRMTIRGTISEALSLRIGDKRSGRRAEAARMLEMVGLDGSALDRFPHEFSGGQRQRIAIARALAAGSELVVLDEMTSALDVSVQATIINLLKDLQAQRGLSYIFISHDLAVVGAVSDVVAVMYLGQIVELGEASTLFRRPRHPYTQVLIDSAPTLTTDRQHAAVLGDLPDPRTPPAGCRFHPRCPVGPAARPERASPCAELDPITVAEANPNRAACHFASDEPKHASAREILESGSV